MSWTSLYRGEFDRTTRDRGEEYLRGGRVRLGQVSADGGAATVRGTRPYSVEVHRLPGSVKTTCTCPRFESALCKHLWATLLALDLDGRLAPEEPPPGLPPAPPEGVLPAGAITRAPRQAPAAPWRDRLRALGAATLASGFLAEEESWPVGRQVVYEVHVPRTLEGGGLAIRLFHRQPRRNGGWSKPRPLRASARLLRTLPEIADRRALSLLSGGRPADHEYGGYDPYFDEEGFGESDDPYRYERADRYLGGVAPSSFRVPEPLDALVLPALCSTGRCHLRISDSVEPEPLAWDDAGAWRLAVRVTATTDGYAVDGWFRRGEDERPIDAPLLVTASGLVFMDGRVALLDHGGAFSWLVDLRKHGRLEVPRAEGDGLRFAYLGASRRPPIELTEDLAVQEMETPPRPRLKVTAPRDRGPSELRAELSFGYADLVVPQGAPGWAATQAGSSVVHVRDTQAEAAAAERLRALGLKSTVVRGREERGMRLAPGRLGAVVGTLAREGWQVEAEGRLYRRPGAPSVRISSGIDWFDLEAHIDFEGQRVGLPKLLQALRRGETTVVLGDGSLGMLPEEWLKRHASLARFGQAEGEALRFRRSQVGLLDALLASQADAQVDAGFEQARAALRKFEGVRPLDAPKHFRGQLREYQALGLGWMSFLREFGFGGCLADDMGLGKTVQVLALLESRRREAKKPSLVVAPRSLVFNWREEAARFTPKLRIVDHHGLDRARDTTPFTAGDLVLTTYGTLRRDAVLLRDLEFDYVVLDEAQAIKNRGTESAKAARLLRADHRLALSGTPVENHIGELQSLFEFLNPGLLGHVPLGRGGSELDEEGRQALARALGPFVLRRTKAQVAKDLPAKTEQTLWCDLEPEQKAVCDELRDHYRASLLARVDGGGLARAKIHVLEALLRLRQAACHPGLLDPGRAQGPSAKLDALLPRLVEVVAEGHKALVFSQFTSFLALLVPRLVEAGLTHEYLDGRTRDRAARVRRFQEDPKCGVFLISLKAGGLGLNLTAAEYVFLLDPWWNPAVEAQAVDRAHRIGQTRPVFAYRLVARDTIEEKVLALQETKRGLADAIVRADDGLLRNLRREDLELLLG